MAIVEFDLITDRRVSPAAFRVLVALLAFRERRPDHQNFGWAFPSQATLGLHLGLHRGTVRRHLSKLAELGVVEIHERRALHPHFRGHPKSKAYKFVSARPAASLAESLFGGSATARSVPLQAEDGAPTARLLVHPMQQEQTQLTDHSREQTGLKTRAERENRASARSLSASWLGRFETQPTEAEQQSLMRQARIVGEAEVLACIEAAPSGERVFELLRAAALRAARPIEGRVS